MLVREQLRSGQLTQIEGNREFSAKDNKEFEMGQSNFMNNEKFEKSKFKIECKEYFPQRLVYEIMVPQNLFEKVEGLKVIHKMIDFSKDSGLIKRQELVSMMPPLLCDIKSHHAVFDMCAAPGSKTAQILEMIMNDHIHIQGNSNITLPRGFVVANDADHKRADLLTNQTNRFNTSCCLVTNHNA
jgi:hypothetical protein